ncbi:uncharacterized protein QC763_0107970 [Podospora pseudopauciseta]|uniref:Heterokaryon incompatibility domain-containing protein n=1 Tax=Podospora pseudopauciseta TaxID=2093780 RepID=A0ABR0H1Z3_9PEZI|nr:hypothetical protein QC763_0107970 [Podospora pseudopauciseta]
MEIEGVDLSYTDEEGRTALIVAAMVENEKAVDILLEDPTLDPNHRDQTGRTALAWAALRSHRSILARLLAMESIDADIVDVNGKTPLLELCSGLDNWNSGAEREAVIRQLLASGRVNINARDSKGRTAVMMVAKTATEALFRLFLSQPGIELEAEDENRANVLLHAGIGENWRVVEILLELGRLDLNCKISDEAPHELRLRGQTIFSMAMAHGPERVRERLFMENDIDVNTPDRDGNTLLKLATEYGHASIVDRILSIEGVNPNIFAHDGETALMAAINGLSEEMADTLLKHKSIDPEKRNPDGRTPLSLAAERGLLQTVRRLLSFDQVDPDSRDNDGRSPLSWAISPSWNLRPQDTATSRKKVAQELLETGRVDLNAEDTEGCTLVERAIGDSRGDNILELLLAREDVNLNRVDKQGRNFLKMVLDRREPVLSRNICGILGVCYEDLEILDNPPVTHASEDTSSEGEDRVVMAMKWGRGLTGCQLELGVQREADYDGDRVEEWSLCKRCDTINLDEAFSRRSSSYWGNLIAKFDEPPSEKSQQSCGLCRLIASVHPAPSADSNTAEEQDQFELRAFSGLLIWLCEGSEDFYSNLPEDLIDTLFLAVVTSSGMKSDGYPDMRNMSDINGSETFEPVMRSGFIARVGSNCSYRGRALSVKHVPFNEVDFGQIKSWIADCTGNHSDAVCNPTKVHEIPHFRLIHCATRDIVHIDAAPPPHTALSYVWGAVQDGPQNQHSLAGLKMETVVEDAIKVTLALGYEYLWVDRYCVDQTPGSVKDEQLRHMNFVYYGAEVTIIDAAGEESSFGLPGVSQRFRKRPPAIKVQGHILTTIPPEPSREIQSSKWATRGWTYQEGLLSRRRLFFTQHEVSFECDGILAREAITVPPILSKFSTRLRNTGNNRDRPQPSPWLFPLGGVINMEEDDLGVHQRLSEYAPRQLTYELDALNAMLGVLQLYLSLPQPAYHLCGILIVPQTHRYDWSPGGPSVYVDVDPNTVAANLAGFVYGLLWTCRQPGTRRGGFPSWSWTGWTGTAKFEGPRRQWNSLVDVSIVEEGKKGLLSWGGYFGLGDWEKRYRFGHHHVLEVEGYVGYVTLREDTRYKWLDGFIATMEVGDEWTDGGFVLTKRCDDEGGEGEFRKRLLRETWMAVVMMSNHVLVVEQQASGLWERMGVAEMWVGRWIGPQPDGGEGLERRRLLLG